MKRTLAALSSALVLLGFTALLLIGLSWYSLIAGGVPALDFAADMLLSNRIRDEGVLLVGQYSRYEFNHPGPFWFYYNHLFELGLDRSGLSRTHIWLFGQTTMATLVVGFTGAGLSLFLFGTLRFCLPHSSYLFFALIWDPPMRVTTAYVLPCLTRSNLRTQTADPRILALAFKNL